MTRSLDYLAGLFDGEGSFSIQVGVRPGRSTGWVNPSMSVNLYYGCEVLEDFVAVFGGKIYPYSKGGQRWSLGSHSAVLAAARLLEPRLVIKKEIAQRFIQALLLYPDVAEGRMRRSWTPEQVIAVAEIALNLNPPRSRKTSKTAEYLDALRKELARE